MLKRARYNTVGFFNELSEHSNYLPNESIQEVYYGFIKMIGSRLSKGRILECPDLGTFEVVTRKAHMALDVKSQVMKMLPPKKEVKFRPCRKMKQHFHELKDKEDISFMI